LIWINRIGDVLMRIRKGWAMRLQQGRAMERIGSLEAIWRYPVKSMAGEELAEAFVGFPGLMGDRAFAFVREPGPSGFPWLTGREQEDLVLYRPRFVDPAATRLPADIEKSLCMGPGVLAVFPAACRFAVNVTTPEGQSWAVDAPELRAELERKSGQKVSLRFSDRPHWDCRPVSLLGNASVAALGDELGMRMDGRRFRANLHVDWDDGEPFRENGLAGRRLQIGDRLQLAVLERDPRCKMVTLDPDTGRQDRNVLAHLNRQHEGRFGVYAAVLMEGIVGPGDPVSLI
jgi:uncharacterized protein YcbX